MSNDTLNFSIPARWNTLGGMSVSGGVLTVSPPNSGGTYVYSYPKDGFLEPVTAGDQYNVSVVVSRHSGAAKNVAVHIYEYATNDESSFLGQSLLSAHSISGVATYGPQVYTVGNTGFAQIAVQMPENDNDWDIDEIVFTPVGGSAQDITGSSLSDADAFGSGAVSPGQVALSGSSHSDADAFGSGGFTLGSVSISGLPIPAADAFGAGQITAGPVVVSGAALSDPDSFGSGQVVPGAVDISGTLFTGSNGFGSGAISTGEATILGAVYTDQDLFGSGSIEAAVDPTVLQKIAIPTVAEIAAFAPAFYDFGLEPGREHNEAYTSYANLGSAGSVYDLSVTNGNATYNKRLMGSEGQGFNLGTDLDSVGYHVISSFRTVGNGNPYIVGSGGSNHRVTFYAHGDFMISEDNNGRYDVPMAVDKGEDAVVEFHFETAAYSFTVNFGTPTTGVADYADPHLHGNIFAYSDAGVNAPDQKYAQIWVPDTATATEKDKARRYIASTIGAVIPGEEGKAFVFGTAGQSLAEYITNNFDGAGAKVIAHKIGRVTGYGVIGKDGAKGATRLFTATAALRPGAWWYTVDDEPTVTYDAFLPAVTGAKVIVIAIGESDCDNTGWVKADWKQYFLKLLDRIHTDTGAQIFINLLGRRTSSYTVALGAQWIREAQVEAAQERAFVHIGANQITSELASATDVHPSEDGMQSTCLQLAGAILRHYGETSDTPPSIASIERVGDTVIEVTLSKGSGATAWTVGGAVVSGTVDLTPGAGEASQLEIRKDSDQSLVAPTAISLTGDVMTFTFGAGVLASAGNVSVFNGYNYCEDLPQGKTIATNGEFAPTFHEAAGVSVPAADPVVLGSLYDDVDSFGAGTVAAGSVSVVGQTHTEADSFGGGSISVGAASITGQAYSDPDSFGAGVLSSGGAAIVGAGFADADAFGGGAVVPGEVSVSGGSISDGDSFGGGSVSAGIVVISGALYSDEDAFPPGVVSIFGGPSQIAGVTYEGSPTFYSGSITTGAVAIVGLLYEDPDTLQSGAVTASGPDLIGAVLIDPDAFFGGAFEVGTTEIVGAKLLSLSGFFSGVVSTGSVPISGATISDADSFGLGSLFFQSKFKPRVSLTGSPAGPAILVGSPSGPVEIIGDAGMDAVNICQFYHGEPIDIALFARDPGGAEPISDPESQVIKIAFGPLDGRSTVLSLSDKFTLLNVATAEFRISISVDDYIRHLNELEVYTYTIWSQAGSLDPRVQNWGEFRLGKSILAS